MNVTNQGVSLMDSVLVAQSTQQDMGVSVLKKAQNIEKQEGAAALRLIEQAGSQGMRQDSGALLDAYA